GMARRFEGPRATGYSAPGSRQGRAARACGIHGNRSRTGARSLESPSIPSSARFRLALDPVFLVPQPLAMIAKSDPQRRRLTLALGALAVGGAAAKPCLASGRLAVDDAGRQVALSSTPQRVFPAGGPAAVFLYCLAPDRLLGW